MINTVQRISLLPCYQNRHYLLDFYCFYHVCIEAAEELKKEQRESEQLNVDPEQVLEEKEKGPPYSVEDE